MSGFTEGRWNGLVNYKCGFCAFSAPGKPGLQRIKRHVAEHYMKNDSLKKVEGALDFASDRAAEVYMSLPEELRVPVKDELLATESSGLRGYTVNDVQNALDAFNDKE